MTKYRKFASILYIRVCRSLLYLRTYERLFEMICMKLKFLPSIIVIKWQFTENVKNKYVPKIKERNDIKDREGKRGKSVTKIIILCES